MTSNGIKLIKLEETNSENLAGLERKIKPMREESRTMTPFDYSTKTKMIVYLSNFASIKKIPYMKKN